MLYDVLMYYTLYLYIVIDISLAIWRLICTKTTFLIVTITFYTKWIHVNLFHQLCISTHWKRPWCWEGLGAGGKGDNRGWDGWKASPTRWMWVSVNSGSWWWTGRPGVLQFMGSQSVGHDWATELNWTVKIGEESHFMKVRSHFMNPLWRSSWGHQRRRDLKRHNIYSGDQLCAGP